MANYFQQMGRDITPENQPIYLYRFVMGRWVLYRTYQNYWSNQQVAADGYCNHVGDEWFYTCNGQFWRVREETGIGHSTYPIPTWPEDRELTEEEQEYWFPFDEELRGA